MTIHIGGDVETLALQLARTRGVSPDEAIRQALREALVTGGGSVRRRLDAAEMLAVGTAITAMPLRDSRSPRAIMDELNA